jgi:hypothetical protein
MCRTNPYTWPLSSNVATGDAFFPRRTAHNRLGGIIASDGNRSHGALGRVVVQFEEAVIEIAPSLTEQGERSLPNGL